MQMLVSFASSESGAVTVDWVVLTASIVGLCLAVMAVLSNGLDGASANINAVLTDGNIVSTRFN